MHTLLFEEVEVGGLAGGAFVRVAEDDRQPVLGRLVFGTACYIGEERVTNVEHDESNGGAASRTQLASSVVAHVAQFIDRGTHFRNRFG